MDKKRIVLMCTDDFAKPLSKYGFEVLWVLPFVYQLFYEKKDKVELSLKDFTQRLNGYKAKIIDFAPQYFIADSGFFCGILNRLKYITRGEMIRLWVDFIEDLNKRGIITIVSCVDDPWQFVAGKKDVVPIRRAFKVVKTHSMQFENKFLQWGQKVIYFPNYVNVNFTGSPTDENISSVKVTTDEGLKGFDLFFVGKMNWNRKIFFWRLSKKLKGLDYFFGSPEFFYTSRKEIMFDPRNRHHMQQLYGKSLLNIIYGSMGELLFQRTWGVTDRIFNIAYCHGFFLCDWRRHLSDLFNVEPKLYTFRTFEQCYAEIKIYLENSSLRKSLSDKFHEDVIRHHTVDNRIEHFIYDLEKLNNI